MRGAAASDGRVGARVGKERHSRQGWVKGRPQLPPPPPPVLFRKRGSAQVGARHAEPAGAHLYLPDAHLKASSRKMKLMPITLQGAGQAEWRSGRFEVRRNGSNQQVREPGSCWEPANPVLPTRNASHTAPFRWLHPHRPKMPHLQPPAQPTHVLPLPRAPAANGILTTLASCTQGRARGQSGC